MKRHIEVLQMFVGCNEHEDTCKYNCECCMYDDYTFDELVKAVNASIKVLEEKDGTTER